jgi:5-methylthioadenosine/S-adenosylhomocysteine deaminase
MLNTRDLNIAPVVDLESTIVRSATPANIDTVMIDGRILKRHRELVAFDVARVVQEAEQSSREVRARAGGRLQPEP